ncbi:hypothetical protein HMPREF9336_02634 [Segniliparus rugosus ATCC BAA-974]|uniref:Amidohydrolase-related domain-containing protein n=2 Tax=Segniliparus rugosus TaxID=286804 RepID=E5XT12_SEGRC|nr:hypothetical protein HMPREF9336_02634 [Segniliparus rugosus ATCC BAA-974]
MLRVMRIIALEEHFTTLPIREANEDHPLESMYRLLAQAGLWKSPPGAVVPVGIDDIGAGRIAAMDEAGIDVQVLSQTTPGVEMLEAGPAVRLAKEANDAIAGAVEAHPARFRGFAHLPVQDPAEAARELERAVTQLGFVGAMLNGHVRGEYLDDQKYWPIFAKAEELGVPVYLHPTRPPQAVVDAQYAGFSPAVTEMLAAPAFGWHVDAGLHALRLILAGLFDRHPGLQMILGHQGETLPFMIDRASERLASVVRLSTSIKEAFASHFSITFAGFFTYPPFVAAYHCLGADRILFSVDYPYSRNADGVAYLDRLPISADDREKIAHRNAERLLGIAPA